MAPPERTARLVLVTPDGAVVGALPAIAVSTPWWQDIGPVVAAARTHHGIAVTILRLLEAEHEQPPGGEVTYLAQVEAPVAAEPWSGALDDQPLRHPYAEPGGPAADLAWAEGVLAERGIGLSGPPTQVRTWNLSSLWRLPVEDGAVWLKVVPPFFAHEGDLLARLAGERVPRVLGHDGGRMLMAEVPGEDLYDATPEQWRAMVSLLVDLQSRWIGGAAELIALGLPDWRAAPLSSAIGALVARIGDGMDARARGALDAFVADLPDRWAKIAACGLPDTLVHSDFAPGNFRGEGLTLTLIDWGDSGVGHPLFDQIAFFDRIPDAAMAALRDHWLMHWRDAIPDCDPARAAALLAPIAAARKAVIYQGFLDHIEPAEHPYHRADPLDFLGRAAALLEAERAAD
jgi:hypothetical protein